MLMVQEWWKWLENEQQQLYGSWRVCSWVRVKQSAINYVRAHRSEAFTLSHLTTNSPASQSEGYNQACYQSCCSIIPSPRGFLSPACATKASLQVYDLGNGKGVPYDLATLLPAYATWTPLQFSCFGSLLPSATPATPGGNGTENTWNGGPKINCIGFLFPSSTLDGGGAEDIRNGGAEAKYLGNFPAACIPSAT
ncbi:hypothetical protein CsSME_00007741 [Camellia sinensis var. sinensis]